MTSYAGHPDLHSFPTRRSSDLTGTVPMHISEKSNWHCLSPVPWKTTEILVPVTTLDVLLATCRLDRKSTRLNSSHVAISYAVFCLKKKSILRENLRA